MIQVAIDQDEAIALPLDSLPIKQFGNVIGWTTRKLESKIQRGQFKEGEQFIRDPDGNIHIIIEGYNQWLSKGLVLKPVQTQSRSGSTTKANVSLKPLSGNQRRLD